VLKADYWKRINAKKANPYQDYYGPCSLNARTVDDINLLTRIAATESVSLCVRIEKLTAFVELEPATRACGDCA
jgi:hypothetical protein